MNFLRQISDLVLRLRNRHFLLADALVILITPAIAIALRFDGFDDLERYIPSLPLVTAVILLIDLFIFYRGGLYNRFWRYASVDELGHIVGLCLLAIAAQTVAVVWVLRPLHLIEHTFPSSTPLVAGLLTMIAVGGLRFSIRFVARALQRYMRTPAQRPVVIVGAGSAGVMIAQEMQSNPSLAMWPVAFVDDSPDKQRMRIRGVRVVGRCKDIAAACRENGARQVVIAMPTAAGKTIREIVGLCEQAGVQAKIMPGVYELLGGKISLKQLREVRIEDLLRREPIMTDTAAVGELIHGKRVLITGGGGSIGSELCRQVLRFRPSSLVILGHGENSVFEIDNGLRRIQAADLDSNLNGNGNGHRPIHTDIVPVIADIRSAERMLKLFNEYRPQIVFHSAAHKHVPLMESNPSEAITNNVIGTRNLLDAARQVGVDHFVMISTDKAVNPTSVMGCSKRVAELLIHQEAERTGKPYVAVRFGNVLGSRGSVVLTFQQQIASGGPLTVTHPDMTRYFMTIPEAVQLVLQAATLGKGGEVFMLDMGEPVKIVDLASDLIKLSGLEVGRDVDIEISGVRPGEKLFEELFVEGEKYARTRHEKIFLVGNASSLIPDHLESKIETLYEAARLERKTEILRLLNVLVPEFKQGRELEIEDKPQRPDRPELVVRELQTAVQFNSSNAIT